MHFKFVWKSILSLWLIVASAMGFAAPAMAADSADVLKVAVSRTPLSLPLWVAESQGFMEAEGLRTEYIEMNGGHKCRDALLAGQVSLATSTEIAFLFGAVSNPDLVMLSRFVTNSNDSLFVVRRQANAEGAWPQKVKKIGTVQGTSAHYFLELFLILNGVDPKTVQITFLPIETLGQELASGNLDAAAFWNPFAENALRHFPAEIEQIQAPPIYSASFNLLARKSETEGKREQFKAFHRAIAQAVRFINEHPADAAQELTKRLDWTDPDRAPNALKSLNYQLGLPSSHLLTMDRELLWIKKNKLAEVSDKATVLNMIDRSILNESLMSK